MTSVPAHLQPGTRRRRAFLVETLYGDRYSALVAGSAVALGAGYTALRTGDVVVGSMAAALVAMVLVRHLAVHLFLQHEEHSKNHPTFWKRFYSGLGIVHMTLVGSWMAVVHWRTSDEFSQTLAVLVALGFLVGVQGRNFSSLFLVRCQLLACIVPMIVGLAALSATHAIVLGLFLGAFYVGAVHMSRRIRGMLHDAIEASEENWRLAHTDLATGLPNRASLRAEAQRLIERRDPFAFLIVHLEGLRRVNETVGVQSGDRFLQQAGETLRALAGPQAPIARGLSDKFLVIQPLGCPIAHCELAGRIVDALGEPVIVHGATMRSSCCVGVSRYPNDGETFEEVAHRADMALMQARAAEGPRFVAFTPGTRDRAAERQEIETGLSDALAQGGLHLHYQPIVKNGTHRVVGCEGLVRWEHPTRGAIAPCDFLPVAEDAGLMNELTDQTLRAGCEAATAWPRKIGISINLSPSQLCRPDLLDMIAACLSRSGLEPERLELEITENMFLDGRGDILDKLQRIRDLGVRLSLDDFGTGYSNLGQIALLPINKIKLDKRFLDGIETDKRRADVLRGAVRLIAPLGLEIVLEGVETREQVAFAAGEKGISLLQGYAFARPMPRDAILRHLLRQERASAKPV